MSLAIFIFSFLSVVVAVIYFYMQNVFRYWLNRDIEFIKPYFPFGNMGPVITGRTAIGYLSQDFYNRTKGPVCGLFLINRPALLIKDLELLKCIMIKDFDHFVDRGILSDEENDPLSGNLFSLSGEKWHQLRIKLTPTFTTGKLKAMLPTILDCGKTLQVYLTENLSKNGVNVFEFCDLTARYLIDIIASIAFGIEVDSINNPEVDFRKIGMRPFASTFRNNLATALSFMAPKIMKIFKIKTVDEKFEKFLISVITETLEYREKNNIIRKDFLQLLIQLRNGNVVNDEDVHFKTNIVENSAKKMTINEVAAQAAIFFLAGFETSSSVISFCLYELAKNQDYQERAQKEIDKVLNKYNGEFTYYSLKEMEFLDNVIDESLRFYPPVPFMVRICTKAYKTTIENVPITIEKGTNILIPILGIQNDPKYFPNPSKFDPDRFNADNENPKPTLSFIPFGEGPRHCIGMRLGRMNAKIGLALLLAKFNFELGPTMKDKLIMDPTNFLSQPIDGIKLRVNLRENIS